MKYDIYFILMLCISSFFVIINYIWIRNEIAPPPWDQSWYLETSEYLYHGLVNEGFWGFAKNYVHALNGVKAPLISVLPIPYYIMIGNTRFAAMCVNLSLIFILSIYTYKLVAKISNRRSGLISIAILHTIPLLYALNRQFFVEYLLTTLVVMYVYYLLESDYFSKNGVNLKIGIVAGLGLLTKVNFPMYVILPTIYLIIIRIKRSGINKILFKNLLIIVSPAIVLAISWYGPNIRSVFSFGMSAGFGSIAEVYGTSNVFSPKVIFDTIGRFISNFFPYFLILLLLCIGVRIVYNKIYGNVGIQISRVHKYVILLWLLFPFIVILFSVNKDIRYVAPFFPSIAILLAIELDCVLSFIKSNSIRLLVCIAIIIYPVASMIDRSFYSVDSNLYGYLPHVPNKINFRTEEVVDYIYKNIVEKNFKRTAIVVAVEHPAINFNTYQYYSSVSNRGILSFNSLGWAASDSVKAIQNIKNIDPQFIIIAEKVNPVEIDPVLNKCNNDIVRAIRCKELNFVIDKTFVIDCNHVIVLYKNSN